MVFKPHRHTYRSRHIMGTTPLSPSPPYTTWSIPTKVIQQRSKTDNAGNQVTHLYWYELPVYQSSVPKFRLSILQTTYRAECPECWLPGLRKSVRGSLNFWFHLTSDGANSSGPHSVVLVPAHCPEWLLTSRATGPPRADFLENARGAVACSIVFFRRCQARYKQVSIAI